MSWLTRLNLARPEVAGSDRGLHAIETRLDALEEDLAAVLAGGKPRPQPLSTASRLSRALIVGGAALVVAAIALLVF